MRSEVRWRLCWENELKLAGNVELAEFFRKTYGPAGVFNAKPFSGSQSWAGARPKLRAIGYESSSVAGRSMSDWTTGAIIDRNGPEL